MRKQKERNIIRARPLPVLLVGAMPAYGTAWCSIPFPRPLVVYEAFRVVEKWWLPQSSHGLPLLGEPWAPWRAAAGSTATRRAAGREWRESGQNRHPNDRREFGEKTAFGKEQNYSPSGKGRRDAEEGQKTLQA